MKIAVIVTVVMTLVTEWALFRTIWLLRVKRAAKREAQHNEDVKARNPERSDFMGRLMAASRSFHHVGLLGAVHCGLCDAPQCTNFLVTMCPHSEEDDHGKPKAPVCLVNFAVAHGWYRMGDDKMYCPACKGAAAREAMAPLRPPPESA